MELKELMLFGLEKFSFYIAITSCKYTLQKQKRDYHSPERVIVALDIALAITSDSHPTLPRVIVTP